MRRILAACSTLIGAVMTYQGLVLGGLVDGGIDQPRPEAGSFLLISGGAMLMASLTVRGNPGIAAVEMTLAGVACISVSGPDHRYLAVDAAAAIVLAVVATIVAFMPSPTIQDRAPARRTDPPPSFHRLSPRVDQLQTRRRDTPARRRTASSARRIRRPPKGMNIHIADE